MQQYQKTFVKYAFPSVMGMVATTLYTLVDGIFVGQYVGAAGLAAIGIIWPFIAIVVLATSIMICGGGGALVSINFGRNRNDRAQHLFSQSMMLITFILGLATFVSLFFPYQISYLFGANEAIVENCVIYLRYFMAFGLFSGWSVMLNIFLNNDRNPNLAFIGMAVGAVTNIILDYVFVGLMGTGLQGAAIASGIGQIACFFVLLLHFICKKGTLKLRFEKPHIKDMMKIMRTGFPSFITEVSLPITAMAYNIVIMSMLGEFYVAAYGIIGYIIALFVCIFGGISQGMQPLVSRYHGEGNGILCKKTFRLAVLSNLTVGIVIYSLLFFFGNQAIRIFTHDEALIAITYPAMIIYTLFAIFAAINVTSITYLQAVRKTLPASILSFVRGIILNILFIIILPLIFGETGIWAATVVTEVFSLILVFCLFKRYNIKIFKFKK